MNTLSLCRTATLGAALALAAMACLAAPASAQVLDAELTINSGGFDQPAMPEGEPATASITINYNCGGLSGDTQITVTADQNVSGASASISPASISPTTPPDCTPGEVQTSYHNVTVSVGKDSPAGEAIPVKIAVAGENALMQAQSTSIEVEATTGPYVEVNFAPKTDAYEVPAGDSTLVVIEVETMSNVEIMTMPSTKSVPEGWQPPDLFPITIASPLAGGNGTGLMEFELFVPADAAPGDHTVEIEVFAHATGDIYEATANQTIPLTISVVPGSSTNGDGGEESPGLAPFPLAVLGAACLALLRRRD